MTYKQFLMILSNAYFTVADSGCFAPGDPAFICLVLKRYVHFSGEQAVVTEFETSCIEPINEYEDHIKRLTGVINATFDGIDSEVGSGFTKENLQGLCGSDSEDGNYLRGLWLQQLADKISEEQ